MEKWKSEYDGIHEIMMSKDTAGWGLRIYIFFNHTEGMIEMTSICFELKKPPSQYVASRNQLTSNYILFSRGR